MSVTISTLKRCSVHLYLQLFVGWFMSYLCYLCLFVNCGVQHILCCVLFFFTLCTLCFQFLWIVFVLFFFTLCTLCFQFLWIVFVLFFFTLCTLCCQFLCNIHFWLPFLYSLTLCCSPTVFSGFPVTRSLFYVYVL